MKKYLLSIIVILLAMPFAVFAQGGDDTDQPGDALGGATEFASLEDETDVTLMLDWTPNTNHIGIYVAQALGYYEDANINLEIIEPVDLTPETALEAGTVDFGIGFQEFTSLAMAEGQEIVSLAAIIQHNTSGFAAVREDHLLETPADLTGLTYGGFSFPDLENPIIDRLMGCDETSWNEDNYLDIGFTDPLELLERERIDFAWIFYAWQGLRAEVNGTELSTLMLMDYPDCVPDYYTPILITSRQMIDDEPEVVEAFVHATARGYAFAIGNPQEAANILLEAVPELDKDLVNASAAWLAEQFQADAPRWGQQSLDVWQGFTDFLIENRLIEEFDVQEAFTNDFLPGTVEDTETETE